MQRCDLSNAAVSYMPAFLSVHFSIFRIQCGEGAVLFLIYPLRGKPGWKNWKKRVYVCYQNVSFGVWIGTSGADEDNSSKEWRRMESLLIPTQAPPCFLVSFLHQSSATNTQRSTQNPERERERWTIACKAQRTRTRRKARYCAPSTISSRTIKFDCLFLRTVVASTVLDFLQGSLQSAHYFLLFPDELHSS